VKAIIGIPSKLFISYKKVLKIPELAQIANDYPDFFLRTKENGDEADFNLLSLFVFWEKSKKEKSFYSPLFNAIERSYTLRDWTIEDLDELQDPFLKHEVLIFFPFNKIHYSPGKTRRWHLSRTWMRNGKQSSR